LTFILASLPSDVFEDLILLNSNGRHKVARGPYYVLFPIYFFQPAKLSPQVLSCHTHRTLQGETNTPCALSSLETRSCPPGRLLQRHPTHRLFHLGRHPVLRAGFASGQFLQRQFAPSVVELLETIEAVP